MPRSPYEPSEESFEDSLADLLNDRIFTRYVTTVGYSSLASVQDCLKFQNQVRQGSGAKVPVTDLLNARNSIAPSIAMMSRRGFRA